MYGDSAREKALQCGALRGCGAAPESPGRGHPRLAELHQRLPLRAVLPGAGGAHLPLASSTAYDQAV